MPRHPELRPSIEAIAGSVFSRLAGRLADFPGETYPLHIGDTWRRPYPPSRMDALGSDRHPGLNRYGTPQGHPELRRLAAERASRRGAPCGPEQVLVTAGATGGLGAAAGSILAPGDRVLLLAPYWPLISGIVRAAHGEPVDVDVLGIERRPDDLIRAIERAAGDDGKTVALYLGTPNNPTGEVWPHESLHAVAALAERRGWWILADEVYEDLQFEGEHVPMRVLAPDRTFAVHSFSKSYGMAGNRCGYVIGPPDAMPALQKVSTHAWYAAPTASQIAAIEVLCEGGDAWLDETRDRYAALGREAANRLGVDPPRGATFLFVDVASRLDDRGLAGFLEDAVDRGLFLAPGPSFGPYPNHVRVCFTACEPDRTRRGLAILAALLGR